MRNLTEILAAADKAHAHQQSAGDALRLSGGDAEVVEAIAYMEGVEDALRWAAGYTGNTFDSVRIADIRRALNDARTTFDQAGDGDDVEALLRSIAESRAQRVAAANTDDPHTFGTQFLNTPARRSEWLLEPLSGGWTPDDVVTAIVAGSRSQHDSDDDSFDGPSDWYAVSDEEKASQAAANAAAKAATKKLLDEQGTRYTVVVEEGDNPAGDEIVWTTQYVRDTYTSMGSPEDAAGDVLATNGVVFVDNDQIWRVLVWAGHHADQTTEPVYIYTDTIRQDRIARYERQEARRRTGFQG